MRFLDSWRRRKRLKKELAGCLALTSVGEGPDWELSDTQKCAIVFMSLPPELSAQLFMELGAWEVQMITLEITRLPSLTQELRAEVLSEVIEGIEPRNSRPPETQLEDLMMNRKASLLCYMRRVCEANHGAIFASLWDHHKLAILMKNLSFFHSIKFSARLAPRTHQYALAAQRPVEGLAPIVEVMVLRELLGLDERREMAVEKELQMLRQAISKLMRNQVEHLLDTIHLTWPKASVNPLYLERRAS